MGARVRLNDAFLVSGECRARLPFRFGVATMTWAPHLLLCARVEVDGQKVEGFAADLLVPKWFDKDPGKSFEQNIEDLKGSTNAAVRAFQLQGTLPLFELWRRTYDARVGLGAEDAPDCLTRGFGVAIVERALIDATCRAAQRSFFEALRADLFEIDPAAVCPELAGWSVAGSLPERPAIGIKVRHTVGLADPIRAADIGPQERVRDGLPQSLDDVIAYYGVNAFKVKLCGDPERDVPRCEAIGALLADRAVQDPLITVDGNEQFEDLEVLLAELQALRRSDAGNGFLCALRLIEQPLKRSRSFDRAVTARLPSLTEIAPVIIDEADYGVSAFPRAVECGYRGVSVKNCKGVFRALLNRGLCIRYREQSGAEYLQSAEDLTNLPVVALQQDLATVAALGFEHVERNGHHYFRGLDHLPKEEQAAALESHPDLYEQSQGSVFLKIREGRLAFESLQIPGYGHNHQPLFGRRRSRARR